MKRRLLRVFVATLIAGALAAQPPEIVTHKQPTKFTSHIEPIPAPLLEKMRATTWHTGCPVPPEDLRQLTLTYWNFKEQRETGKLIVNKTVAEEVTKICRDLFHPGFLLEKMAPVEDYNGSDDASMAANNTSAFNCRDVTGWPANSPRTIAGASPSTHQSADESPT